MNELDKHLENFGLKKEKARDVAVWLAERIVRKAKDLETIHEAGCEMVWMDDLEGIIRDLTTDPVDFTAENRG